MYIFIDIGGTKTRVGVSYTGDKLDASELFETNTSFDSTKEKIVELANKLTKNQPIREAVCGVPGVVLGSPSVLVKSPHLSDWNGLQIEKVLSESLKTKVTILNDTALVGLGEAVYGGGKGYDIVTYLTISTGVGGVRIVDKRIDRSAQGFEIGHQLMDEHNTLEELISGSAMQAKYGKHPREVLEKEIWDEQETILARALSTTIYYWSPNAIVIGGSMVKSISLTNVASTTKAIVKMYDTIPPLLYSTLGEFGGLHGGLAYIQNNKKKSIFSIFEL
jgi:glucokinase